jgi:hypothetical protein
MDMKKLLCVLVLGGGLMAVGCGDDDGPGPMGGADAGPGVTYTFVVNHLDVGQEDPMGAKGVVPGFNLDGTVSDDSDPAGCFHTDFTSPAPDNEAGVDNQLGPILGSLGSSVDVSGTIAENIADGSLLLFVEVEDVNDLTNDSDVTVNLLLGQLPAGVTMPMLSGDRLAPGQTFDILSASYSDGMAGQNPMITAHGAIVNGRITTDTTDIPLNLPIMDVMLALNIQRARIRFNIAETTIGNGIIGGSLDIDELVTAVMAIPALADYVDLLMNLLDMNADLDPDAAMMGDCQSVSLGLVFDGVPATKGAIVAMAM